MPEELQRPADGSDIPPVTAQPGSPAPTRALSIDGPPWVRDFEDLQYEWRRLFAEFVGTFLLVVVAAGAARTA